MDTSPVSPEGSASSTAGGSQPKRPAGKVPMNQWLGLILGGLLLAGGIGAILLVEWSPTPPPPPEIVRPVKATVVLDLAQLPERRFSGKVLPGKTVELAFQVSGPLLQADLTRGRKVLAGEVLAQIDPQRFEQQISVLKPQLEQAESKLSRVETMFKNNAATEKELVEVRAERDRAAAQLEIAQQALQDTTLKAPFAGIVVDRLAENFQTVQAGQTIVRFQDITNLDIAIDIPETMIARYRKGDKVEVQATFPAFPSQTYGVDMKEVSADADSETGTYRVVFTMPRPTEFTALPGMAATIIFPGKKQGDSQLAVPTEAIFVGPEGEQRVWVLNQQENGTYLVTAKDVSIGSIAGDLSIIESGLDAKAIVATAGVGFLSEGQRVKLLEDLP